MSLQRNAGAVRRFARAMSLGAWLQRLPERLVPPPFRLIQIGSAFWQSRALYVAARLDIATVIGDARLDASELAARLSADADALGRLLRMLSAMGVFEEVAPRVFRNNRLSQCLRTDHPQCVRSMVLMHNAPALSRPWFEALEAGVRSGATPFALSHGEPLFAYLDRHPDDDRLFSEAMDSLEPLTGDGFATDFDWGRFTRLIDVGGSRGRKSLAILRRHPGLAALVVDRPQVIEEAQRYWRERAAPGLERLRFAAGDVLAHLPPAQGPGDIYLLSAVLHGFDDATALQALRTLAGAIGQSGARIAVLEMVLPETGADAASCAFDMQMLVCAGGRERTRCEWTALIAQAGLVLDELVGLRPMGHILVLRAP